MGLLPPLPRLRFAAPAPPQRVAGVVNAGRGPRDGTNTRIVWGTRLDRDHEDTFRCAARSSSFESGLRGFGGNVSGQGSCFEGVASG